jgi:L-rhamnose mutarotase
VETVALHTRLKPGREADYEAVHAKIPDDLDVALREAGVHSWRIWRSGLDLFHLVEVDDYEAMKAHLRDHPADIPWQARMSEFLDDSYDYNGGRSDAKLVWALP